MERKLNVGEGCRSDGVADIKQLFLHNQLFVKYQLYIASVLSNVIEFIETETRLS